MARIGPVNREADEFNLYVPIADDDRVLQSVHGSDDRAALEQIQEISRFGMSFSE